MLKKIKSIFIVDDEPSASSAAPAPQSHTPAPIPVAPADKSKGAVSEKFMEVLTQAVNDSNQPGFDYLEFRQALHNLAKMPMDEPTRIQSAYAMAQTLGVTAPKLIESARFYLGILNNERQKFDDAHAQQRARLIGNREEEARRLHAESEHKQAEIERLTREIAANKARIEQLEREIGEVASKIESTKADFDATFAVVSGQIEQDIEKLSKYLNA